LTSKQKGDAFFVLFLVEWNFRQDGRLDYVFGFFCFFSRVHQLTAGIDQARGHEDDQVPFDVLGRSRFVAVSLPHRAERKQI
jgi:hypothetical protein